MEGFRCGDRTISLHTYHAMRYRKQPVQDNCNDLEQYPHHGLARLVASMGDRVEREVGTLFDCKPKSRRIYEKILP